MARDGRLFAGRRRVARIRSCPLHHLGLVLRLPLLHTSIRVESSPGGWGGADGMREAAVRKPGKQQEHAVAAACATCTPKQVGGC